MFTFHFMVQIPKYCHCMIIISISATVSSYLASYSLSQGITGLSVRQEKSKFNFFLKISVEFFSSKALKTVDHLSKKKLEDCRNPDSDQKKIHQFFFADSPVTLKRHNTAAETDIITLRLLL